MQCLTGQTRLDTSINVCQKAKIFSSFKATHGTMVKYANKILLGTTDKGLKHELDLSKGLDFLLVPTLLAHVTLLWMNI